MAVRTEVRYLNEEWRSRPDRPFICSRETRHQNTFKTEIDVHDGRTAMSAGAINVRENGLTFTEHETEIEDYTDAAAVKAGYDTQILPMLLDATGATAAFMMGHQVRNAKPETFLGAYSRYVHCDYPMHPSPGREQKLLESCGSALADEIATRDYAWFNVWEAIERPAMQNQLCVMDGATLNLEDVKEYYFDADPKRGYASLPLQHAAHHFYYFPNMVPGEAIIFKQFDSRDGHPMVCPHTSFFDAGVGEDPLGRRSVEYRALCVF